MTAAAASKMVNALMARPGRCSGLTTCGSAAGGMPAHPEFYVPLIAIGEQRRAEPGALRACQLQPLVRLRPTAILRLRAPNAVSKPAPLARSLPPTPVESCGCGARRPSGRPPPGAPLAGASPALGARPRCGGAPRELRGLGRVHEGRCARCSHPHDPVCCWSAGSLTTRGSAAGAMSAPSEFYGPLSATDGQHPGGARGAPRPPAATAG